MTLVACLLAVALVAEAFLFLRHQSRQEQAWTVERRELLTRIQRPELVPVQQQTEPLVLPDPEPDERDLVGTVAFIPDLEEE